MHKLVIGTALTLLVSSVAGAADPVTAKDVVEQYAKTKAACALGEGLATGMTIIQLIPLISSFVPNGEVAPAQPGESLGVGTLKVCGQVGGGLLGFVIENVADGVSLCIAGVCHAAAWASGTAPNTDFDVNHYGVSLDPIRKTWQQFATGPDTKCSQESKKMELMYTAYKKVLAANTACTKPTSKTAVTDTKNKPVFGFPPMMETPAGLLGMPAAPVSPAK